LCVFLWFLLFFRILYRFLFVFGLVATIIRSLKPESTWTGRRVPFPNHKSKFVSLSAFLVASSLLLSLPYRVWLRWVCRKTHTRHTFLKVIAIWDVFVFRFWIVSKYK
jgi:hypothetical protein